jgi:hypothetical protein
MVNELEFGDSKRVRRPGDRLGHPRNDGPAHERTETGGSMGDGGEYFIPPGILQSPDPHSLEFRQHLLGCSYTDHLQPARPVPRVRRNSRGQIESQTGASLIRGQPTAQFVYSYGAGVEAIALEVNNGPGNAAPRYQVGHHGVTQIVPDTNGCTIHFENGLQRRYELAGSMQDYYVDASGARRVVASRAILQPWETIGFERFPLGTVVHVFEAPPGDYNATIYTPDADWHCHTVRDPSTGGNTLRPESVHYLRPVPMTFAVPGRAQPLELSVSSMTFETNGFVVCTPEGHRHRFRVNQNRQISWYSGRL